MNSQDKLKKMTTYAKETEKMIKRLQDKADLENPVDLDLVKTLKAQAYEDMVSVLRLKA
nr:MAG: hypothetical protein [Bacteriophage sp.]